MNYIPWGAIDRLVENILTSQHMVNCVQFTHKILTAIGVPENHTPDAEQLLLSVTAVIMTLISYWYWLGKNHLRKRRDLESNLLKAQRTVRDLEEKLLYLEKHGLSSNGDKEIRIFMDGAFDMMHYGHMNAFRKGRAMGTKLIVGVNSDETITVCKGAPVMNDEERMAMVRGCKFVDEVVPGVPYVMNDEYLKWVINEYKIDYVVHGDDPCIVDGKDVYESAQKMGKYLTIPRTEGISTTDIVGRMLLMTRSHHSASFSGENSDAEGEEEDVTKQLAVRNVGQSEEDFWGFDRKSDFLTTSHVIRLFGAGTQPPKPDSRVVYVAGAFDMFHAGHVAFLEKARAFGDYLIVGIHADAVVNSHRGLNYPLMSVHERALSVLGCKFVDDVLLDAPYFITKMMIASLKICAVVRGSVQPEGEKWDPVDDEFRDEMSDKLKLLSIPPPQQYHRDPYALPREMGILHVVPSTNDLTAQAIVDRIHLQRERHKQKFAKKKVAEEEYYDKLYTPSLNAIGGTATVAAADSSPEAASSSPTKKAAKSKQ